LVARLRLLFRLVLHRQARHRVVLALVPRTPDPDPDADEGQQQDHSDDTRNMAPDRIHGATALAGSAEPSAEAFFCGTLATPSPCRYAIRASIAVLPSSAWLAESMSASL